MESPENLPLQFKKGAQTHWQCEKAILKRLTWSKYGGERNKGVD